MRVDGRHHTGGIVRYGSRGGGGRGVFVFAVVVVVVDSTTCPGLHNGHGRGRGRGGARVEVVAGASRRQVIGLARGTVAEGVRVGGQRLGWHRRRAGRHLDLGGDGPVVAGPRMGRQILPLVVPFALWSASWWSLAKKKYLVVIGWDGWANRHTHTHTK